MVWHGVALSGRQCRVVWCDVWCCATLCGVVMRCCVVARVAHVLASATLGRCVIVCELAGSVACYRVLMGVGGSRPNVTTV